MKVRLNSIGRFSRSRSGNFAVAFALISSMVLGLVAGVLDLYTFTTQKSVIQESVDAAALAAVSEAALKGWDEKIATSVAEAAARANYLTHHGSQDYYEVKTTIDSGNRRVTVEIIQDHYPFFYASMFSSPQITASATATAAGSTNVCVIGLDESSSGTVLLTQSALMTAGTCAVYSNSTATDGVASSSRAILMANLACSAGGYAGALTNFKTVPITDCPKIADPLANRAPPTFSTSCNYVDYWVKPGSEVTLMPGVYCGGIDVGGNASVKLRPGIYIIKDGPVDIYAGASFVGESVGFYFTGKNSIFSAYGKSIINLKAPASGPMAGLLMYQDRASAEANFVIKSQQARNLLGTIYLPNGNLIVDANNKIAEESAYTAIVVRRLQLGAQTDLVLNTDYSSTTVPVPGGLGPNGGADVRLVY